MNNTLFTPNNWNHCNFKNNNLKAIISLGASPDILDDKFKYFVTVLDNENNEVYQAEFDTIDTACHHINKKYSHVWDFEDLTMAKTSGGCGSCSAH